MSDELTAAITGAMENAGLSVDVDSSDGDGGGDGDADLSVDDSGDAGDDDTTASDADDDSGSDDDAGAGDTGTEGDDADASSTQDGDDAGKDGTDDSPVVRDGKEPHGKKKGPIPFPRHESIIKNIRDEYEHPETGKLTQATRQLESLSWARDPEAYARHQAFGLAESNPEKFARLLVKDPSFAKILQLRGEGAATDTTAASSKGASKVGAMPGPDKTYKDPESGQEISYYSNDGLKALSEWQLAKAEEIAEQASARTRKELDEAYEQKYGPLYEEREASRLWTEQVNGERKLINHAREHWPEFKTYEKDIEAAVFANPKINLFEAFISVVPAKLLALSKTNRDAMRKELLAELNKKKKAATPPSRPPAPKVDASDGDRQAGDDELMAVIRQQVRTKLRS